MADMEFTQICKEILGIGKRLEKIEPEELREIKASIERLSEAFNASKESFDESKSDFDGKYNKVTQIVATFDALKAQVEEVLKSGTINDSTEALISTFSSKKIMDLLNEAKGAVDEKFSTIHKNGITPWSSSLDYPAGAISVLNGKLYQAKTQNTNKNPSENKEKWRVLASEEWCEQIFLNKDEKIDAYTKQQSDDKFAPITSLPELATETKAGIAKLKNIINAKQTDTAVTEKAVSDAIEAMKNSVSETIQLSTNGYIKLPSGLILQWARATSGGRQLFPIAFPNECFFVSATHAAQQGSPASVGLVSTQNFNNSGATFWSSQSGSGAMLSGQCLLFFAIGW